MEIEETINQLLSDSSLPVDIDWARKVMKEHPTFAVAGALLLQRDSDKLATGEKAHLQAQVMLAAPDPIAMSDLADLAQSDWRHFYPYLEKATQKSTVDTIDTFLNTYGHASEEEDALLERMIFNPVVPDYFSGTDRPYDSDDPLALPPELQPDYVADTSTMPEKAEDNALSNPMLKQQALAENEEPQSVEEPLLMESLAKIFIKQHRYERAFEIIKTISLKNPEKSAYFADQLRFLQKLINNQRYSTRLNVKI